MILVDLNQVLLAGLMVQISGQKNVKLEEDLIRHLALNILRGHIRQFRQEYGEVVLCCDNKKYWRKEFFPFYKASRKKNRDKSDLDWHLIFDILGKLKQELKDNFPYKVITFHIKLLMLKVPKPMTLLEPSHHYIHRQKKC